MIHRTRIGIALLALPLLCTVSRPAHSAPPAYHLVKSFSLEGNGGWDYLTLDSPTRRLYIARSTHVTVVNVDTGALVADIPNLGGVHGVAIDHRTGRGFASCGRTNTVVAFDLKTFARIADIPVGKNPDAIIRDGATGRVFAFNGGSNSATAIDPASNSVVGTVELPGRPEFAVADGSGHIYNNLEDRSAIASINTRSLKVENVWPIGPGEEPSGLAMDVKNRRLFSVCSNQSMAVINADSGRIVQIVPIGNGPDAAEFDAASHLAFSPNGRDGTVTVIRQLGPDKYEVLATVPTMAGARTTAFDPKTRRVITVSAKAIPPAPGDSPYRRNYVPGSFTVLEYGP